MGVVPVQGPQLPAVPGGVFINMSARAGYGISGGFFGQGDVGTEFGQPGRPELCTGHRHLGREKPGPRLAPPFPTPEPTGGCFP